MNVVPTNTVEIFIRKISFLWANLFVKIDTYVAFLLVLVVFFRNDDKMMWSAGFEPAIANSVMAGAFARDHYTTGDTVKHTPQRHLENNSIIQKTRFFRMFGNFEFNVVLPTLIAQMVGWDEWQRGVTER